MSYKCSTQHSGFWMIQNMSYDRGEQLINETTVGSAIINYFAVEKKNRNTEAEAAYLKCI